MNKIMITMAKINFIQIIALSSMTTLEILSRRLILMCLIRFKKSIQKYNIKPRKLYWGDYPKS